MDMEGKMNKSEEIEIVLGNMVIAVNMLQSCPEFTSLIPEVRVNLVYALPQAKTPQDVAAITGRITAVSGLPRASGMPALGASDHLARRILEIRKYDPALNAAINFKCNQSIIEVTKEYCQEQELLFGWLDRTNEPAEAAEIDGASMPWKVTRLVESHGAVPRLFYEGEGWGKETLFLALGKDAVEVTSIAIEIARRYQEKIRG